MRKYWKYLKLIKLVVVMNTNRYSAIDGDNLEILEQPEYNTTTVVDDDNQRSMWRWM